MHHAMLKKPDSKTYIPNSSIYITFWRRQTLGTEKNQWLPGDGCKRQELLQGGKGKIWGRSYGTALYFGCGESMTVCLSQLPELYNKRGKFSIYKMHLNFKYGEKQ